MEYDQHDWLWSPIPSVYYKCERDIRQLRYRWKIDVNYHNLILVYAECDTQLLMVYQTHPPELSFSYDRK